MVKMSTRHGRDVNTIQVKFVVTQVVESKLKQAASQFDDMAEVDPKTMDWQNEIRERFARGAPGRDDEDPRFLVVPI